MQLWIATANDGKLREYKALLDSYNLEIFSSRDIPAFSAPPENGKTFVENARIKAKSLHAVKNKDWVLGEDSGLEVDGLNNLPGIHSARYAGDQARDAENTAKVLRMLKIRSPQNRKACFRCIIVLYSPEGKEFVFEETLDGQIAEKQSGTTGFGYDPIFIPDGESQTLAELGLAFKNANSHRARCVKKLLELVGEQWNQS